MPEKIKKLFFENRFWKSIFRHDLPVTARLRSEVVVNNVFLHIHPVKIFKDTLTFSKTMGLGLIAFYLFIILTVTGLLLMFYYVPFTGRAYQDIKDLNSVVSFGMILRNMHRWSAQGMIVFVFFHMCRVFYTAAFRESREFNWVIGIFLFLCTLLLGLTGYLLLWDQVAFWATTIISKIIAAVPIFGNEIKYLTLGGTVVGQNALLRFYVFHVAVLPLITGLLIGVHFWLIRKSGGLARPVKPGVASNVEPVAPPAGDLKSHGLMSLVEGKSAYVDNEPDELVTTWPHLFLRELNLFLLVLAVIIIVSILIDAPLEEMANPAITPNPAKAPWYFLGLQELLSWGPPFWGGILVPGLSVIGLIVVPYFDRGIPGTGEWFHPSRRVQNILFTVFVVVAIGLIVVGTFMRGPNWAFYWPWESWPAH